MLSTKEVVVVPEYPDLRNRVLELEDELAKIKINMEAAHLNELDALNRKIAEL